MNWDERFLEVAAVVAGWSKDPSSQVGAVIADSHNRLVSVGFNGFPRGVADDSRLHDRETKYGIIIHAETNAVLFAERPVEGCTLYVVPFMPCSQCAALVIQAGIKRVVTFSSDNERWLGSFGVSRVLFEEAGVELVEVAIEAQN